MSYVPTEEDLLDWSKPELVSLCDELIQVLRAVDPEALEKVFPEDEDEEDD